MHTEHFTKANLTNLPSCFLDPKGNFIFSSENAAEIGVHESLAFELIDEVYGEDYINDNYDVVYNKHTYLYEYLEEDLGYFRFSHWVGCYGVFNGEKDKITHAQKLAIREFCRINGVSWHDVVGD